MVKRVRYPRSGVISEVGTSRTRWVLASYRVRGSDTPGERQMWGLDRTWKGTRYHGGFLPKVDLTSSLKVPRGRFGRLIGQGETLHQPPQPQTGHLQSTS